VLRTLVGRHDAVLRDDQWAGVEALVAGRRRALLVQRTGWGKSAVYFVATALLRARGAGPTLIVSPLLALMRNQRARAARLAGAGETAPRVLRLGSAEERLGWLAGCRQRRPDRQ
jgi:ATP-dependent DNA helicase RecQ